MRKRRNQEEDYPQKDFYIEPIQPYEENVENIAPGQSNLKKTLRDYKNWQESESPAPPPPYLSENTANQNYKAAYDKYVRLKYRQQKLRALRMGISADECNMDQPVPLGVPVETSSDTKSMTSLMSYTFGRFCCGVYR